MVKFSFFPILSLILIVPTCQSPLFASYIYSKEYSTVQISSVVSFFYFSSKCFSFIFATAQCSITCMCQVSFSHSNADHLGSPHFLLSQTTGQPTICTSYVCKYSCKINSKKWKCWVKKLMCIEFTHTFVYTQYGSTLIGL
jgi:hypothetical protein